jgi:hypothetical protein
MMVSSSPKTVGSTGIESMRWKLENRYRWESILKTHDYQKNNRLNLAASLLDAFGESGP